MNSALRAVVRGVVCVGISAAACFLSACPSKPSTKTTVTEPVGPEPVSSRRELRRELESTVLEVLGQLTLGNVETYTDGLRRDKPVTLIGLEEGATFVGEGRDVATIERWPLMDSQPEFLSKNLDISIAKGGEVGWTFDEVSLRVLVDGRLASVPLRVTLLFVRDVDRWVVAHDHWSLPMSSTEILAQAQAQKSVKPERLPALRDSTYSDTLVTLIGRLENGDPRVREQQLSRGRRALVVLPGIDSEFRGAKIDSSPTLLDLFEGARTVGVRDHRVESSASGEVAWLAANLVVRGDGPAPYEVQLRASYVFVHSNSGWKVVHEHVSVPISNDHLSELLGLKD